VRFDKNECVCHGDASIELFSASDLNFDTTNATGKIRRCLSCRSIFPEKIPTSGDIARAYADYYTDATPKVETSLIKRLLNFTRRDYLRRHTPETTETILDYGCGSGAFLAATEVPKRFGSDFRCVEGPFEWIPIENFPRDERKFDWITISHTIEHVPDPGTLIETLAGKVSETGAIWISTPNADSYLLRVFGPYSRDVDFPRHRVVLSREGMLHLLAEHGLTPHFLSPPRLNAAMNFLQCAKLAVAGGRMNLVVLGALRTALHLLWPSKRAAPELIVIARPN
jgi:SAM-dependent methyltransferase